MRTLILLCLLTEAAAACLPPDAAIISEHQDKNMRAGVYVQDGQRYQYRYLTDRDYCHIQPVPKDRNWAALGQWADLGTTAVGLSVGGSELNPLGPMLLPAKYVAYEYAQSIPECKAWMGWLSSAGWSAAAWNVLAAAGAPGGLGAAAALAAGIAAFRPGVKGARCEF